MRKFASSRSLFFSVALAIPPGSPAIEINGFHLVEAKQENKQIELRAKKARLFKPEDIMAFDNLEAQIWGKPKKPYVLSGDLGIMNSDSRDFRILRSAEVKSPDGYKFETTNVRYDQKTRAISGDDPVEASPLNSQAPAQFKISGVGLLIDLEEREYEILKNVKTRQRLGQKNSISINSHSALISPDSNQATFRSSVIVKSPTIDMRGERLQITFGNQGSSESTAEVTLQPKELLLDSPSRMGLPKKSITANLQNLKLKALGIKIELAADGSLLKSEALGAVDGLAKGDVKLKAETLISDVFENQQRIVLKDKVEIIANGRLAKCEEAQYFPESGDVILEKIASVETNEQTIEGDLIKFSTKNSEIIVERARGELNKSSVFKKQEN